MLNFQDGYTQDNTPVRFCNIKIKFQLTKDLMINAVCRVILQDIQWDGDSVIITDTTKSSITKAAVEEYVRTDLRASGENRFYFDVFDQFISDESQEAVIALAKEIVSDFYDL